MAEHVLVATSDPVLRGVASLVPKNLFNTKELEYILSAMKQALRKERHGVAIAAPQVGIPYRIFVVRGYIMKGTEKNATDPDAVFINPTVVRKSKKVLPMDGEGCLSVPGVYGTTLRSPKMTVRAYDAKGKKFERGADAVLSHIFQHELDHLDGILFIDHATDLHTATRDTHSPATYDPA